MSKVIVILLKEEDYLILDFVIVYHRMVVMVDLLVKL